MLGEGSIEYLCVWNILEVTDIRIRVIETSFEDPRPSMDGKIISSLSPIGPGLSHAGEEKSNGSTL